MRDIVNKKELSIFNKSQLIILRDILNMEWTVSSMTGCIEFKIECRDFVLGGNNSEEL